MNNIITKEVVFNDDKLIAAHDLNIDKVYVGVKWVCQGIGLTKGQTDRQILNIQSDEVLSKGASYLRLPTKSGYQSVSCIEIDFLPLWLAKISITPKMKENKPKVVEKLIQYQLKAKDVLYEVFIKNHKFAIPKSLSDALRLAADLAEEKEILKNKADNYDRFLNTKNLKDMGEVAKIIGIPYFGRNKLLKLLRQNKILMDEPRKNIPYQQYMKYFKVIEIVKNNESIPMTLVKSQGVDYIYKLAHKQLYNK